MNGGLKMGIGRQYYVGAYHEVNLRISEEVGIMGWKKQPTFSLGDLIFMYNTTSKKIEVCFQLVSRSSNDTPIWEEELNSKPKRIIYKYRYNVSVMSYNLNLSLDEIYQLEPFKSDPKSIIILKSIPRSIEDDKFSAFKAFLSNKSGINNYSPYTIQELCNKTFMKREMIQEYEHLLLNKRQIIFYGPPGTGKTFLAIEFSKYLADKYGGQYKIIQFHPSYGYEDFIEGIRPYTTERDDLNYKTTDSVFKDYCNMAKQNYGKYILIIDEINRGNLPKIFGELLYSLEYRDPNGSEDVQLPYSKEMFRIPENILIIGTMNSADRSTALVDYALRRRFYFISIMPSHDILMQFLNKNRITLRIKNEIINIFDRINSDIKENIGSQFQLGHSYFMNKSTDVKEIIRIWRYSIRPILEEYYFDQNPTLIDEYEKIILNIGNEQT